jgi:integrase
VAKSAVSRDKKRRALSVPECRALLEAAPEDRRLVYMVLVYTGLRRAEAAALNWGHVHLDVVNPYLELPASITKSGKPETVPLVPEAAAGLREHRGDAEDRDAVFASIPSMDQFRADLAAAGIADEDERGRKVVLHSLRHSLATMLAQSKVPPAIAQKIMRHSDIRLTLQHYTDEGLLQTGAAMANLPRLTPAVSA